jgi:23S rRNA pseudouridine1911/1915/1917 synthase
MEKNINLIVEEVENNLRLDVFINKRERLISRTRIKNLILKKKLKINNHIINSPSKKVSTGDKINLLIPEPKEAS